MKNMIKTITTVLVAAVMLLPLFTVQSNAASSVYINTKDKINGGETFYITVTYDGSNIGRVDAGLNYDTDKLAYISGGNSSGNSGYVHLKLAGTGEAIKFDLKFQAISEGSTSISVETNEMYDLDERYMSDTPYASKQINVVGNAAAEDIIEQETDPDEPEEFTGLKGVDEKTEGDEATGTNLNLILIIGAAVIVLLIVIVSIIIAKRSRKKKNRRRNRPVSHREYDDIDRW